MEIGLLLASVAPPAYLLKIVYDLDKIEPEPPKLLIYLFIAAGFISIPGAYLIEQILPDIIFPLLRLYKESLLYNIIDCFVVVALAEEGFKFYLLKIKTWKLPDFDYRFDGVVYAVAVSLGFAAFENIAYVFTMGLRVAAIRTLTAIPIHCIAGIYMGHYYGTAKYYDNRGDYSRSKFFLMLSVLIPVIIHGFYDLFATYEDDGMKFIFIAYVVILNIVAMIHLNQFAKNDEAL